MTHAFYDACLLARNVLVSSIDCPNPYDFNVFHYDQLTIKQYIFLFSEYIDTYVLVIQIFRKHHYFYLYS